VWWKDISTWSSVATIIAAIANSVAAISSWKATSTAKKAVEESKRQINLQKKQYISTRRSYVMFEDIILNGLQKVTFTCVPMNYPYFKIKSVSVNLENTEVKILENKIDKLQFAIHGIDRVKEKSFVIEITYTTIAEEDIVAKKTISIEKLSKSPTYYSKTDMEIYSSTSQLEDTE